MWFEDDADIDNLRTHFLLKLTYKLFRTAEDSFNYSAMLLSFCKGNTNVEGFAKALSLVMGRPVCWDEHVGRGFIKETMEKRRKHANEVMLREQELLMNKAYVHEILDDLIDQTVHICDSVVIEDIVSEHEDTKSENEKTETELLHNSENEAFTSITSGILTIKETSRSNQFTSEENNLEMQGVEMDYEDVEYLGEGEPEPAFSNIAIGFEASESPNLAYFLPLQIIHIVLNRVIPDYNLTSDLDSRSKCEKITDIYEKLRNEDFHNEVLAHQFLNCNIFTDFLDQNANFIFINPVKIVDDLVNTAERNI